MSHFAVLVALKPNTAVEEPSPSDIHGRVAKVLSIQERVAQILDPYHEFECTGRDDQYVQDINITEKLREEYGNDLSLVVVDSDGNYHEPYDDKFYRNPNPEEQDTLDDPEYGMLKKPYPFEICSKDWDGSGQYSTRVYELPEGWEKKRVPTKELQTFKAYCGDNGYQAIGQFDRPQTEDDGPHKYGYVRVDDQGEVLECIDRTNPNKKWDWYQIGGRFIMEYLHVNDGTLHESDTIEKCTWDITAQRQRDAEAAGQKYDRLLSLLNVDPETVANFKSWAKLVEEEDSRAKAEGRPYDRDIVQKAYTDQRLHQAVTALCSGPDVDSEIKKLHWEIDSFGGYTREAYVEKERLSVGLAYAAIKEGEPWLERGTMGWFGVSMNETTSWEKTFSDWLDSVPEDWTLVLVDCHI